LTFQTAQYWRQAHENSDLSDNIARETLAVAQEACSAAAEVGKSAEQIFFARQQVGDTIASIQRKNAKRRARASS
jgi:hypothetical protein